VRAVAIVLDMPADIVRARNRGRATGVVPDDAVDRQLADLAATLRPGALDAEGFAVVCRLTQPAMVDALEVRRA
jgi:predicted kinase